MPFVKCSVIKFLETSKAKHKITKLYKWEMKPIRLRYSLTQKVAATAATATHDSFLNGYKFFNTFSIKRWGSMFFLFESRRAYDLTNLHINNKMGHRLPKQGQKGKCSFGLVPWTSLIAGALSHSYPSPRETIH